MTIENTISSNFRSGFVDCEEHSRLLPSDVITLFDFLLHWPAKNSSVITSVIGDVSQTLHKA